jgi:hypothetical protein
MSRSVVINLHHMGNPKLRTFAMNDPEAYVQENRQQLLSELVNMVESWKDAGMPLATTQTRFNKKNWGNIIGGILEANGEPDFLDNADETAAAMDDTRREFSELVGLLAQHPKGTWTAAELTDLANEHFLLRSELGQGTPRSQCTRLGVLAGRYVDERFGMDDGSIAIFHRSDIGRKTLYHVGLETIGADV